MLIEVKVPALSESVADGTLVNWHKKTGEFVKRNENLVDLETDKVVLEIVAPKDGVLKEITKGDGVLVAAQIFAQELDALALDHMIDVFLLCFLIVLCLECLSTVCS